MILLIDILEPNASAENPTLEMITKEVELLRTKRYTLKKG